MQKYEQIIGILLKCDITVQEGIEVPKKIEH